MKLLYRFLLGIVCFFIPVFIAACYGVQEGFDRLGRTGRVVDSTTMEGIGGLKVTCIAASISRRTDASGFFDADDFGQCTELSIEDIDGAENGEYPDTTVSCDTGCDREFQIEQ